MSQDIRDFIPLSCELLGLGEPTHQEPAFGRIRNELFAQSAAYGFRSIALETDRVAALVVDDFVRNGIGTLDGAMSTGFSHEFGKLEANRQLVDWMRAYNADRQPQDRLSFHGFDIPTENTMAPSPRVYLEYARDYLGLDLDIATLAGADELWNRTEAILDASVSIGATAEAEQLRAIADDLLVELYARAPGLIAAGSRAEWSRAKTHLTAGLALLRYHRRAAERLDQGARIGLLLATRDALMAENLLDIRRIEARRGKTVVHAHNLHLRRDSSSLDLGDARLEWSCAGAIVNAVAEGTYGVVVGSLGRSETLALADPAPGTYEASLRGRFATWGLAAPSSVGSGTTRTDTTPPQGYFPLDRAIIDAADAVLHVDAGDTESVGPRGPESVGPRGYGVPHDGRHDDGNQ
ncbi:erythromycin esterase family protein [Nocardia jejuensis]|uniref:erythromycin esterase family protein n=1 Tax=Nocardia jejuensis TaxID=328049 RepID=UPI0008350575|nr:erythromycin esterase family protein [Nocardia jejuensis]